MIETVMTPPCYRCHRPSYVQVDPLDYQRWCRGALIQDVWPDWTPAERELLKTGIHSECWKAMCEGAEP